MKMFNAAKALESYMRGETPLNAYGADELNDMLTVACAGDMSNPARKIACYLHCIGGLPERRRFLVS